MSILEADTDEKDMLAEIVPDSVDDGTGVRDSLIDSWVQRLIVERKKIWWKDLYELDLAGRSEGVPQKVSRVGDKSDGVPERESGVGDKVILESLAGMVREVKEMMEKSFEDVKQQLGVMDKRLTKLEEFIDAVELVHKIRRGEETGVEDVAADGGVQDAGGDTGAENVSADGGVQDGVGDTGAENVAADGGVQDAVGDTGAEDGRVVEQTVDDDGGAQTKRQTEKKKGRKRKRH